MREEDGPAVADEVVEVDVSLCRFSLEVWRWWPIFSYDPNQFLGLFCNT
jgi:hypothetical protein